MPLIACPECRQTISSEAKSCPHCGEPLAPGGRRIDYVTGEPLPMTARPAVQLARRPFRYPSRNGLRLMTGGSLAVILGSFLPWAGSGGLGISGEGPITFAVGISMSVLAWSARSTESNVPRLLVLVGAAVAIGVVLAGADAYADGGIVSRSIGTGMVLIVAGSLAAGFGSFLRER